MIMKITGAMAACLAALAFNVQADWTDARCDIYPRGEDHTDVTVPCTFSQRQGYVTITLENGETYDLEPEGETLGNFRDQHGQRVYRESGLGDQGLIFRFPDESVYVYWNPGLLAKQDDPDNWTAPFTTDEYDATTRLNCKPVGASEFQTCPAGILRMEDGQASIVIQNLSGEIFTINFMSDYVNASNREADASLEGDSWTVTINGDEIYEVPLAAIEGG